MAAEPHQRQASVAADPLHLPLLTPAASGLYHWRYRLFIKSVPPSASDKASFPPPIRPSGKRPLAEESLTPAVIIQRRAVESVTNERSRRSLQAWMAATSSLPVPTP